MDFQRCTLLLALILCGSNAQNNEVCHTAGIGEKILTVPDEYGCGILQCYNQTSNSSQYNEYDFEGWILPNLQIVNTTYDDGRITVQEDPESFTIQIRNVTRADVGLYHCMLRYTATDEYYLIRLGLNAKGPFFVNRWDEYRMNTIVGCSAFGGFIVLTLIIYLFWHFRYQAPEEEVDDETQNRYTEKGTNMDVTGIRLSSVPGYVPSIEAFSDKHTANWSFGSDTPKDLRKRQSETQGFENKGFVSDDKSKDLNDKVVGDFFGANDTNMTTTPL